VIAQGGASAAASLRGFQRGFDSVSKNRSQAAMVTTLLSNSEHDSPKPSPLPAELAALFPQAAHAMLALGHARVLEYQDGAYARLYVERLEQVLAAERAADTAGANGFAITTESARWLALWMAFDDIVRVAELKSRASRWQRVRTEVKAGVEDLLQVFDHFKPGVPELAALLPSGLAGLLLAWDRRRQQKGSEPWAMPLKVSTHSVLGMLSLRFLAKLKWLRRRGSRFAQEQVLMEQWLDGVIQGTRLSWAVGSELAQCGRLIKGYGSTNERGKNNLLHILSYLAQAGSFATTDARAGAIAAARAAALTDEAGNALDVALLKHGVPARDIPAQPIRWVRQRPGATGGKR
jgi:indolepyruvate ferredoxin oxidoreductase beta subunit